jgi:hypothetical protein
MQLSYPFLFDVGPFRFAIIETSYYPVARHNIPEERKAKFQTETSVFCVGTKIPFRVTSVSSIHYTTTFLVKLQALKQLNILRYLCFILCKSCVLVVFEFHVKQGF